MKLVPSVQSIRHIKQTDLEFSRIALADAYDLLFATSPPLYQTFDFLTGTVRAPTQADGIAFSRESTPHSRPSRPCVRPSTIPRIQARDIVLVDERGWELTGVPIKFRDETSQPDFGLPEVGQYTEGSLHEAGYGDTGIAALRDAGVF